MKLGSVASLAQYWYSGVMPAGHVAVPCSVIAWPVANTVLAAGASSTTAVHGDPAASSFTVSVFELNRVVVPWIRTCARNW